MGLGETGFAAARERLAGRPPPEIIAAAAGVSPAGPEGGGPAGRPGEEIRPDEEAAPDVSVG